MPSAIEDYALIGDCQTAALVGNDGSVDWLCFPRFDSDACFAALLGTPENGRWQLAPVGDVRNTRRRYRDDTLVLETDFETDDGLVTLIDFMPLRSGNPDLVRIVEGKRGQVPMRMDLDIRFGYGSVVPWLRSIEHGIRAVAGPDTLYCRTDVELRGEDFHTVADFMVSAGQRVSFDLTWCRTRQSEPPEKDPEESLQETESWWREWSGRCTYDGGWRDAVVRSLITPTGGLVAAPTTSLPEQLGGERKSFRQRFVNFQQAQQLSVGHHSLELSSLHDEQALHS